MTPDLCDELSAACCNVTAEDLKALCAAGIPEAAFDPLLFGLSPIEPRRGGLFDMADAGEKAVVVVIP